MAESQPVAPVKLLVAILWAEAPALAAAEACLSRDWGAVDFRGPDRPFDATDYYASEMGAALQRRLISFTRLVPPESLRQAKVRCNAIEAELAAGRGRRVNLDIGYLDHHKVVLASLKYAGQKIHLGDGVYVDLIARYKAGRYQPFEWTFPDFQGGRYDEELGWIRRRYLEQRREFQAGSDAGRPGLQEATSFEGLKGQTN